MANFSNCLRIVNAMPQQDQDALLARLDELQAQGMPVARAQIQAAIDVLAGLERQAARLAAIPEDQDVDPDAPDADDSSIKRSAARNPMGFYSALAKGVESMQTKSAPAGAWKTQIKGLVNKGAVKADEIEWSGINDFLDLQEGKASKDQVLEYLRGNGVRVEEVSLQDDLTPGQQAELDELHERRKEDGNSLNDAEYRRLDELEGMAEGTKYSQYTLPGGANYREVLLTLPEPEPDFAIDDFVDEMVAKYGREAIYDTDGMVSTLKTSFPAMLDAGDQERFNKVSDQADAVSRAKPERYTSSHWDQKNVLAHIRLNDRTDADGARVLFVEELQSDWGQEGKKRGWFDKQTQEAAAMVRAGIARGERPTPEQQPAVDGLLAVRTAPFVNKTEGWLNLGLKRVIAMAVDGGYDKVAFTTGEQNAERYSLDMQISKVEWITRPVSRRGLNSTPPTDGTLRARDKNGEIVIDRQMEAFDLGDNIGKELAQKLIDSNPSRQTGYGDDVRELAGIDLKVPAKGMRDFYDKIVPNAVKALLKKVGGGQMEAVSITSDPNVELDMWEPADGPGDGSRAPVEQLSQPGFTITPAMREKVGTEGLPLFSRARNPQVDTPEFKQWFGDSKVVDVDGKPLVVYHGGAKGITAFDKSKVGANFGYDQDGFFFTTERGNYPGTADNYAGDDGEVYPVYLSLQNPYTLEQFASDLDLEVADLVMQEGSPQSPITVFDTDREEIMRRARKGGYDGVTFQVDYGDDTNEGMFVAFEPEQIKSATSNSGAFNPANPDITKSTGRTATGAAWDSPSASKFDDMVYKLQDKQIDLKRVSESIKDAAGAIADDLNVYLQEELFHGRAAKRTEDFVNMELNPLVEQMAKDDLTIADVEEYMHARHAPEANAVIAQRNPGEPGLQDGGSGMTNSAAAAYMASLSPQDKALLDAAAAKVDAIISKTRDLYVDYELESRDTVNGWASVFQHYIPLQREDKDGAPGMGQGFSVKGKETKGRTGSTRKVVDILANVALQRERAIVRGEKDRVARALVGLAEANPNPEFWTVDEVPTERVFNPSTGLVEDRADPMYKNRPNAVVAKVMDANGQIRERAVVFNEDDPRALRMATALKNLDAAKLEGLLGASAVVTRYFSASVTQWNPLFGPVNMIRDVQAVALNLSSTPLKGDERKVMRSVLPAMGGVYMDLRAARKGRNTGSQWANLWDEFQEVGGQTGYRDLFKTSADRAEAIQKALDPASWTESKLGKIFTAGGLLKVPLIQAQRAAGWLFDWLSDYNDALENGVRLSVYKAGLDRGMSKQQAASIAKNISTNFNRKGQIGQQAGAMYAFFNAAVQGTARMGDTLFDMEPGKPKTLRLSSVGKKIVGGGILLGAVQAMLLAAAGFDDEDPPQFARERALIIPIGDKKYLTIPMPLGFNVIPNIGRITTEFALGGFKNPHERAIQLLSLFSETFNPIGSAGLSMQTLAPTPLDPLVALTENKDWTGKPIARESSNPSIPGHALAKDTATTWSKLISESVNSLSGGNKYVAGVFSPSPDQIDYLVTWATGGVGREISKLDQTVTSLVQGDELPPYKIPLVGRFYGNARSQASEGSAFYANAQELNKLETEIKGLQADGKAADAAKLRASRSDAYLISAANQAERQIQRLRTQKRELIKADAPREQVKAIDERITQAMARLNRQMESLLERDAAIQ